MKIWPNKLKSQTFENLGLMCSLNTDKDFVIEISEIPSQWDGSSPGLIKTALCNCCSVSLCLAEPQGWGPKFCLFCHRVFCWDWYGHKGNHKEVFSFIILFLPFPFPRHRCYLLHSTDVRWPDWGAWPKRESPSNFVSRRTIDVLWNLGL